MRIQLGLLLGIGVLVLAAPAWAADTAPVRTTPFPDVPRSHWAFAAVEELRERGILRGYPAEPAVAPAPAPLNHRSGKPSRRHPRRQRSR